MSLAVIHESAVFFTKKEAKYRSSSSDHFGSTLSCSSRKHKTQPFCLLAHGFGLALGESNKRRPTSDATVSTFTAKTCPGGVEGRGCTLSVSSDPSAAAVGFCCDFRRVCILLHSKTREIAWCSRGAPKILALYTTLLAPNSQNNCIRLLFNCTSDLNSLWKMP